jgi:hypothetical protein
MQPMTQSKLWDILTLGDVFTDIVMTGFSHWPQPGEEVNAQQSQREIGGVAITAWWLGMVESERAKGCGKLFQQFGGKTGITKLEFVFNVNVCSKWP